MGLFVASIPPPSLLSFSIRLSFFFLNNFFVRFFFFPSTRSSSIISLGSVNLSNVSKEYYWKIVKRSSWGMRGVLRRKEGRKERGGK